MELNVVYNEDCLEGMNRIDDKSIDMILCDLPYGTTACKWDTIIPFEPLWEQYERIIKDKGAIVLTASQPFTSKLVVSNIELFKYSWIWEKDQGVNFQLVNYQPLKLHEDILVFSKKTHNYYPQGLLPCSINKNNKFKGGNLGHCGSEKKRKEYEQKFTNYPKSIIKFNKERGLHPTQKPVELFEYLIKTYTKEGDIVLDNCMGSGTTAIACMNTNRNFIGFELDKGYYDIILERIKNHKPTIIQDSSPGLEAWF
jgi:site-specific DNA-methyltransferase (adenine-specific)